MAGRQARCREPAAKLVRRALYTLEWSLHQRMQILPVYGSQGKLADVGASVGVGMRACCDNDGQLDRPLIAFTTPQPAPSHTSAYHLYLCVHPYSCSFRML